MTYRPLPVGVTIAKSKIEGLGLFTTQPFAFGYIFGVSHIYDERFEDNYIRTPLGGFFNHSDSPNCEAKMMETRNVLLRALRDIVEGEELTVKYWLYDMESESE